MERREREKRRRGEEGEERGQTEREYRQAALFNEERCLKAKRDEADRKCKSIVMHLVTVLIKRLMVL